MEAGYWHRFIRAEDSSALAALRKPLQTATLSGVLRDLSFKHVLIRLRVVELELFAPGSATRDTFITVHLGGHDLAQWLTGKLTTVDQDQNAHALRLLAGPALRASLRPSGRAPPAFTRPALIGAQADLQNFSSNRTLAITTNGVFNQFHRQVAIWGADLSSSTSGVSSGRYTGPGSRSKWPGV